MKIELSAFLKSLSRALDYVEREIIHANPHHETRVAILSNKMAAAAGFDEKSLFALTQAAILHDAALSEFVSDELSSGNDVPEELYMASHCIEGEKLIELLPMYDLIKGAVLYHHDRADGLGATKATAEETPFLAQLIHTADVLDVNFDLYHYDARTYNKIKTWLPEQIGTVITQECADLAFKVLSPELLELLSGENCVEILDKLIPDVMEEISLDSLKKMSMVFASITDYKSHFTWRHSLGVAEKAMEMGKYYGYDDEMCDMLYIAGALHDIGKLLIHNDILEKNGKLTDDEYRIIKNHAMGTWVLLKNVGGLEEISKWAAHHHERLDGKGYPFGLKGDVLGKNERLMACCDIYQALVEERSYKAGFSHQSAMAIMNKMVIDGALDGDIVKAIDNCFGERK